MTVPHKGMHQFGKLFCMHITLSYLSVSFIKLMFPSTSEGTTKAYQGITTLKDVGGTACCWHPSDRPVPLAAAHVAPSAPSNHKILCSTVMVAPGSMTHGPWAHVGPPHLVSFALICHVSSCAFVHVRGAVTGRTMFLPCCLSGPLCTCQPVIEEGTVGA